MPEINTTLAAKGEFEAQRKISLIACACYVTTLRHNNQLYVVYSLIFYVQS